MNKNEKNILEPLISVIVPIYKTERYIHRCIDSILGQTYKNLEIILVDDGSPDKCGEICDEYQKIDARVKAIHQDNCGISEARNAGLNIASGEYVAFVDSDDYIQLNMYENMLSELKKGKADICVCQWQYENTNGKQVVNLNNIDKLILGRKKAEKFAEFLYHGQYENGVVCAVWNKLYKRDIFKSIRFVGIYCEDERIHNHILSEDYYVVVIPEQLYIYCQNTESLTNQPFREESLLFLDILIERIKIFSDNQFLLTNTKKLYCNMYIEYFYKAEKAKINMPKYNVFDSYTKQLWIDSKGNVSFMLRILIFRLFPNLYRMICHM